MIMILFNIDLSCFVCFFKQKTAYEMRISDWSSDVCSSDLAVEGCERAVRDAHLLADLEGDGRLRPIHALGDLLDDPRGLALGDRGRLAQIGRASCRERVCQYV